MSRASKYLRNCILALAFWAVLVLNRAGIVPEQLHLLLFAVISERERERGSMITF